MVVISAGGSAQAKPDNSMLKRVARRVFYEGRRRLPQRRPFFEPTLDNSPWLNVHDHSFVLGGRRSPRLILRPSVLTQKYER